MSVYVSKEELLKKLEEDGQEAHTTEWFRDFITALPAADVRENKKAAFKTVFGGNFTRYIQCSRCGQTFEERTERQFNACPFCFARREQDDITRNAD